MRQSVAVKKTGTPSRYRPTHQNSTCHTARLCRERLAFPPFSARKPRSHPFVGIWPEPKPSQHITKDPERAKVRGTTALCPRTLACGTSRGTAGILQREELIWKSIPKSHQRNIPVSTTLKREVCSGATPTVPIFNARFCESLGLLTTHASQWMLSTSWPATDLTT